jgi:hypothetical protein
MRMTDFYLSQESAKMKTPEAARLIELCGNDGDLSKVIKENHDLIPGLTEYVEWRDKGSKNTCSNSEVSPFGHSLVASLKNFTFPTQS